MSRPHSGGFGMAFDPLAEIALCQRRRMSPERFWAKVDRDGPTMREDLGPCWVWTGRPNLDGYGIVSWAGRDVAAHRLACALAHGPIPRGRVVLHACDHPPCVNPAHLQVGTVAQNNADMMAKGRHRMGVGLVRCGAANHKSKLTDELVREYRAAWRAGESIKSISRRSGLTVGTIHPALHGKTWKHVEDISGPTILPVHVHARIVGAAS